MDDLARFEKNLREVVARLTEAPCPPKLAQAIEYAVFSAGNRLRPRLLMAVAKSCGKMEEELCLHCGAAVELMHSASLVHDDLPAFDNADVRRGIPSVHAAYGVATAVLVGDALLVGAFSALAEAAIKCPERAHKLMKLLTETTGCPAGIIAGQAWEQEENVTVQDYHQMKTAALFEMAAMGGALCSDQDPESFRALGHYIGMAYQTADDLRDELGDTGELGKPSGKDRELNRPSIVAKMGVKEASNLFEFFLQKAIDAVPVCNKPEELTLFVKELLERFKLSGRLQSESNKH